MSKGGNNENHVVDFNEVRANKLDEKRRKTERIFFKHLLGVYCVMGDEKMRAVELVEVSEEGCSFQVPHDTAQVWPPQGMTEFPLRLYFSQDTYLPLQLKITRSRPSIEDGVRYVRFGCSVDQSLSSYEAYVQFVKFLKAYSTHAHKDMGDISVFYL